ncbi:MAG: hypothetical protein FDX30_08835 [Chlorobium sp.]|nr:MAG: hypothetical protein FDX30_08835 [Chlorobium sp.]
MKRNHKTPLKAVIILLIAAVIPFLTVNAKTPKRQNTSKQNASKQNGSKIVTIAGHEWMVENLAVDHYRNGDPIPMVEDPEQWVQLTTGAWCYYENRSENGVTYGKLYNWYAVNDPRGLAPEGWHVATDNEWNDIVAALGGEKAAGTRLKSTVLWKTSLVGSDNSSGFTAIPSGYRSSNGTFSLLGTNSSFWTATEENAYSAWYRDMYNSYSAVYRISTSKTQGFAVRCVKNY